MKDAIAPSPPTPDPGAWRRSLMASRQEATTKLVGLVIAEFLADGHASPGSAVLQQWTSLSRSTVRRALHRLAADQWLTLEPGQGATTSSAALRWPGLRAVA